MLLDHYAEMCKQHFAVVAICGVTVLFFVSMFLLIFALLCNQL